MSSPEPVLRASEGGTHYYRRDGTPCYEVMGKTTNKPRPVTIKDAREMQLVPSVTTVTACAAKPGLETWKVTQGIMAALTLPRRPHEPDAEYVRRIIDDSKEQARAAAEEGERIHAALQGHYELKAPPYKYHEHVDAATQTIRNRYGEQRWVAEESFASPLGYGGKIDLHNKTQIMGDFKTKDFDEPPTPSKKLHWPENAMQGAAYMMGRFGSLDGEFFNIYVSRTKPGLVHLHVWERADLEQGWAKFQALLAYFKADRQYDSGWSPDTHRPE